MTAAPNATISNAAAELDLSPNHFFACGPHARIASFRRVAIVFMPASPVLPTGNAQRRAAPTSFRQRSRMVWRKS